jgi:hypothetical protein
VNTEALIKFSKDLRGFKTMVRKMIAIGKSIEEIHFHFPKVTQEDLNTFLANEELDAIKNRQAWGKAMRELDLRGKNTNHLPVQLLSRLHTRYKFSDNYNNDHQTKNIVNTQVLVKFNKDLSNFKTMVRKMIFKGKSFEETLPLSEGYARGSQYFPGQ